MTSKRSRIRRTKLRRPASGQIAARVDTNATVLKSVQLPPQIQVRLSLCTRTGLPSSNTHARNNQTQSKVKPTPFSPVPRTPSNRKTPLRIGTCFVQQSFFLFLRSSGLSSYKHVKHTVDMSVSVRSPDLLITRPNLTITQQSHPLSNN